MNRDTTALLSILVAILLILLMLCCVGINQSVADERRYTSGKKIKYNDDYTILPIIDETGNFILFYTTDGSIGVTGITQVIDEEALAKKIIDGILKQLKTDDVKIKKKRGTLEWPE